MTIAGKNFLARTIQIVAQIISYLNNERKTKEKKGLLQMLANLQNTHIIRLLNAFCEHRRHLKQADLRDVTPKLVSGQLFLLLLQPKSLHL